MPWIIHWSIVGSHSMGDLVKTGIPLLLAALLWGYRRAFARPTWMETGTLVYLAAAGVITHIDSGFYRTYGDVIDSLALCGIWMGTLSTSMPLTGDYSKWHYHPALWTNHIFIKTNAITTAVWGGIFIIQAVMALAGHFAPEFSFQWMVARHLMLLPGIIFTIWFVRWYPAYGSVRG
ncbi:MAG: hypothetical protein ACYDEQ_14035 [Desulfocucumaceae bacterium]